MKRNTLVVGHNHQPTLRQPRLVLLFLTLGFYAVFAVLLLSRLLDTGQARWLVLEMPSTAYRSQELKVKVSLDDPGQDLFLRVDLHWIGKDRASSGYFAGSIPVKVTGRKQVVEFSYPMALAETRDFVFPVAYLSPDGSWGKRVKTAHGMAVQVLDGNPVTTPVPSVRNPAQDAQAPPVIYTSESLLLRLATAGIWLMAAILGRKHRFQGGILYGALAASLWEASRLDKLGSRALRRLAWQGGWYFQRQGVQFLAVMLILATLLGLVVFLYLRFYKTCSAPAILSLTAFWGMASLRVLSLHDFDSLISESVLGFQLGQVAGLIVALLFFSACASCQPTPEACRYRPADTGKA